MKSALLKLTAVVGITAASSVLAQAQVKMGDNLGNHTATKTLNMGAFDIWNTTGVSIGTPSTYSALSASIALQIADGTKALMVSTVANTAAIVTPANGMIVYSTADNMLMVYSNSAWVGFLSSGLVTGAPTAATVNGITITPVTTTTNGVTSTTSTITLAPASLTTPGIVNFDPAGQTFGGPKTFAGNVVVGSSAAVATSTLNGALTVGSVTTPATSTLNGDLVVGNTTTSAASTFNGAATVTGKTILTGNSGTIAVPVNGVFIPSMITAANTGESTLVIDNISGEVRKSLLAPLSSVHISVPIPTVVIANNTAVQIALSGVTGVTVDDGIAVNYQASEVSAAVDLPYIAILSAVATGTGTVLVTVADMRDPSTATTDAGTLLSGKHFYITRYAK